MGGSLGLGVWGLGCVYIFRGYIGIMENKMEPTTMGLYEGWGVWGGGIYNLTI